MNEDPSTTPHNETTPRNEGAGSTGERAEARSFWAAPIGWWFAFDGWRRVALPEEEYVLA